MLVTLYLSLLLLLLVYTRLSRPAVMMQLQTLQSISGSGWVLECEVDLLKDQPRKEVRCSMPSERKLVVEKGSRGAGTPGLRQCGVSVEPDSIYRLSLKCVQSGRVSAFLHISEDGSSQHFPREASFYDICAQGIEKSVLFRTLIKYRAI